MVKPSGPFLTVVLADGDRGLREAVKLYASVRQEIRLRAAVATGAQVLDLLKEGQPPDVLIADACLPDMSIFELLSGLARLCLKDPPAVVVSMYATSETLCSKLLTAGADFFILKPYHLDSLFETAVYTACSTQTLQERRAYAHINWHLLALKAPASMEGTTYMRWILSELVLRAPTATADELYRTVALRESHTTPNTISKAIGRAVQAIWKQNTQEYQQLCAYCGEGTEKPLANMRLLKSLALRIRWELWL